MSNFEQQRHKPASPLSIERPLVLACPALRSRVNLSRIVRLASCSGIRRIITCGSGRLDEKISRGGEQQLDIETHRSLLPVLQQLKDGGMPLIGLEQTSGSSPLTEFEFPHTCVLVLGHERQGLDGEILSILDWVVEIPVFGPPHSFNVATAASMAVYEYCRQYPQG